MASKSSIKKSIKSSVLRGDMVKAVVNNNVEAARKLFEKGVTADIAIPSASGNQIPLITSYKSPEMLSLFLEKGGDINAFGEDGATGKNLKGGRSRRYRHHTHSNRKRN